MRQARASGAIDIDIDIDIDMATFIRVIASRRRESIRFSSFFSRRPRQSRQLSSRSRRARRCSHVFPFEPRKSFVPLTQCVAVCFLHSLLAPVRHISLVVRRLRKHSPASPRSTGCGKVPDKALGYISIEPHRYSTRTARPHRASKSTWYPTPTCPVHRQAF